MEPTPPLFSRIDTVILRVRDLDRALDWYAERLGLASVFTDPAERLAVLEVGNGSTLTLWELKEGETAPAVDASVAYPILGVDDADAAHALLRGRGVDTGDMRTSDGVRFFAIRDRDGNRLEACQVLQEPSS